MVGNVFVSHHINRASAFRRIDSRPRIKAIPRQDSDDEFAAELGCAVCTEHP